MLPTFFSYLKNPLVYQVIFLETIGDALRPYLDSLAARIIVS
jgi:hypothetical protein